MNTSMGILYKLGGDYDEFTVQERKIKAYIRNNLRSAATLSIGELAQAADVSKSTISRFCRRLGYESYRDFSLALAHESALTIDRVNESVGSGETANDIATAVLNTEQKALEQAHEMLKMAKLTEIVDKLLHADRVMFFSIGGSTIVATDLYHKLCRMGISCCIQTDMTFQKVLAMQAKTGDVVWIVSFSGYDAEMIRIAHKAHSQGAVVIAMLNENDSPLAKECDYLLYGSFLDNFLYTGTTDSRLSLMYINDVLYTLLSIRGAPGTIISLQETKLIFSEHASQNEWFST